MIDPDGVAAATIVRRRMAAFVAPAVRDIDDRAAGRRIEWRADCLLFPSACQAEVMSVMVVVAVGTSAIVLAAWSREHIGVAAENPIALRHTANPIDEHGIRTVCRDPLEAGRIVRLGRFGNGRPGIEEHADRVRTRLGSPQSPDENPVTLAIQARSPVQRCIGKDPVKPMPDDVTAARGQVQRLEFNDDAQRLTLFRCTDDFPFIVRHITVGDPQIGQRDPRFEPFHE